jgi:drug/metabolite transporter (DMT)-like permease
MTSTNLKHSKKTRGYAVAIISAAILSTTGILVRYLTQTYQMPALVLAFWRDIFVTITLLPFLALWKRRLLQLKRKDLPFFIGYGFILAAFNVLWTYSVSLNGAAIATVLVYCSTAFTATLGWWLLGEHLGWVKVGAIILSLGGCLLVSEAHNPAVWNINTMGILTGILSGLGYAAYTLMGRSASQKGINPWTSLLYTFAFASVVLLILNLLLGSGLLDISSRPYDLFWLDDALGGWLILFVLAAGPTLIGFGLYNLSLGYLASSVVNLIATLEPVFTALIAYFLLNEHLSEIQVIGSTIILLGVVLPRVTER